MQCPIQYIFSPIQESGGGETYEHSNQEYPAPLGDQPVKPLLTLPPDMADLLASMANQVGLTLCNMYIVTRANLGI